MNWNALSPLPEGLSPETGPWTGIPAARGAAVVNIPQPNPLQSRGTVACWICLNKPVLNGPGVETDGFTVLEIPGFAALKVWWYYGYSGINWEGVEGNPGLPVELPGIPGPQWIHLCYTWDAEAGRMDGYINGTALRLPGATVSPWKTLKPLTSVKMDATRCAVADVRIRDHWTPRDGAVAPVPVLYRGALDHMLGVQPPAMWSADEWRGEALYTNPLDRMEALEGWKMEGPGELAFQDGWMRMWSGEPDTPGPTGHIVHWCNKTFPGDYLVEFDVRILGGHGLNILFFSAKGRNGEDALNPSLKLRTGVFGHYTQGDLDCYHISYYAHTPDVGGRTTSNLRKNHGFFLVDNGPIGIPPGSEAVHRVALLKCGGRIRLAVDGRPVIDWQDDGRHYGPALGGGKIALRQMKWTVAAYRNLSVSALATDMR